MSELLGPIFVFDVGIDDVVEEVDIDRDDLVSQLRACQLTDEAINDTVVELKSGVKPCPSEDGEWAEATARHLVRLQALKTGSAPRLMRCKPRSRKP
jgi:hypothetical protein